VCDFRSDINIYEALIQILDLSKLIDDHCKLIFDSKVFYISKVQLFLLLFMSTPKELAVELFVNELINKLGVTDVNIDLLNKVVSKLAPISYDTISDSAFVSGNDQTEIDTVVKSLFVKHLGYEETTAEQEAMVRAAIEKYGMSNRQKYRVPLIYVILADNNLTEDYLAL
jgi:hypothetical protein